MSNLEEAPYRFIYDEVTVNGKKVKVYRLGKYGKELVDMIPTLAPDSRVTNVLQQLIDLENFVKSEILPFTMSNLLDFITEHPDIDTKTLHNHLFDKNGVRQAIRFEAFEALRKEGKIESVKVGRGKPRKWRVKKEEKP
jgi:exonuclease V gamma subunit